MRSREWERRAIAVVLLALVIYLAVAPPKTATAIVLLAVAARLLVRVVAFYFPLARRDRR